LAEKSIHIVDSFYRFKETTWEQHLRYICCKLHVLNLAYVIEMLLFKNFKIWEPDVSKLLAKTYGNLFVDVGACYGRYTVMLGKNYKRIIAVEPDPQNMQIARCNINYARLQNVQCFQCAVSDQNGFANLYSGKRPDWHTLCFPLPKGKRRVKTLTLASILKGQEADLVKVDVEGAEWLVLTGAESIVDKIKSWVVEIHDLEEKRKFEKWFLSHGYFIQWIKARHLYAKKK